MHENQHEVMTTILNLGNKREFINDNTTNWDVLPLTLAIEFDGSTNLIVALVGIELMLRIKEVFKYLSTSDWDLVIVKLI